MARFTVGWPLACAMGMLAVGETFGQSSPMSIAAPTASSLSTPGGLVPSGVLPISPTLLPSRAGGPSLAPASVPGDQQASLASRAKLTTQLREGRREKVVPVPPTLEIEVLDPNADPLGNPAVLTTKDKDGRTVIDIPPVVLVLRYYFTGERSFQGPMLPGGPSILVMSHPKTGERIYVEAQMLPGAPRVTYSHSSIDFDYGPQAIILKFGHHGKPSVVYRQGTPLVEKIHQASEARHEKIDQLVERTGLPAAAGKIHDGARNAVGASADGVRSVGKRVAAPVVQLIRATPLSSIFSSNPENQALRERDQLSSRAEAEAKRFTADIPTIR